jgi:hypothetical protein
VDLTSVSELQIPNLVLTPTLKFLEEKGRQGHEGFVVWGGRHIDDDTLQFTSCYVPEQTAHKTPDGLLVVVEGDALFRMNRAFYERGSIGRAKSQSRPECRSSTRNISASQSGRNRKSVVRHSM